MRFLGIGDSCDLGALYLRLIAEGHQVKVWISNALCRGTLAGLVEQVADWKDELAWIKQQDGIILFENVAKGRGELQDELRQRGFRVVGGSAFGDKLENDRGFAQKLLAEQGLNIAATWEFDDRAAAMLFLQRRPARYVLKFNGEASVDNYVGRLADGSDVRAYLANLPSKQDGVTFILMEFVDGVEMGVGAYFNTRNFITPACLDWEHKRFFPGDLGELTGEMGTVTTYRRTQSFFKRTLGMLEGILRDHGHCGYVNINTIVNERGIWPLEFTCRFGYPGFAILDPLQETRWGDLFQAMVSGTDISFATRSGFCVGIVLTTPPFPYSRPTIAEPVGLPVIFDGDLSAEDQRHLHYGEVGLKGEQLVTSGVCGYTMVVTGTADNVSDAQQRANALADRVLVPNVRYRRDIGTQLLHRDYSRVERLGLLD